MAKKFLTGLNLVALDADPAAGSEGELYFNSSASVAKIYQAGSWSVLGAGGGGGAITVSTTEPASPETGDAWYKNDTGEFYVYDGTYWVEVNGVIENSPFSQEEIQDYIAPLFTNSTDSNVIATYDDANNVINLNIAGGGGGGATTTVSENPPASPSLGDTWYKQSTGSFFIYDSSYWVEVNGIIDGLTQDQVQDYASTLFTHNNHSNITATYDDANGEIILTSSASGSGDLVGPESSTDNAIARYDLATGKLVQNSLVTIADDGSISTPNNTGSKISFYFADVASFPAAGDSHGAVAHAHNTGKMYYAHGGAWIELSNASDITDLQNTYLTQASASTTYATQANLDSINGESDQFILPSQIFG